MDVYRFGPFELDAAQGLLSSPAGDIALPPKAFDTLRVLVERAGTVLSKQELIDSVWPDTSVEENNLAQTISLVRKALAAADPKTEYVQTIPRRGYRFVADVERNEAPSPQSSILNPQSASATPAAATSTSPGRLSATVPSIWSS